MEKFLFTDGSGGFREVETRKELEDLLGTYPDKSQVRIWVYGRNEWLSYAAFLSRYPFHKRAASKEQVALPVASSAASPVKKGRWKRKLATYLSVGIIAFLVFNFTRLSWGKSTPLTIHAHRPANVPEMDVDSLINDIETTRGQKIDKNTKGNLRLRNTWPNVILLQVATTKQQGNRLNKFSDLVVRVDNTTGHPMDEAVVKITSWQGGRPETIETLRFGNIQYNSAAEKQVNGNWKADSITVSFQSITAKSFNFCYSSEKDNPSGNYNDRWFCRSN